MLLQSFELLPINLVHIAFFTLTSVGALLIWHSKIYKHLAYFFSYQSILMLLNFFEETRLIDQSFLITPALNLAVGPLIYFFVRSIVHDNELTVKHKIAHFLPMVTSLPFTQHTQIIIAIGSLSQIIYLFFSFKLLNRYHTILKSVSADADSMALVWIEKALLCFTVILVTDLIRLNLQTNINIPIEVKMAWYFINTLVLFCVSLFLLYKAIKKPHLFNGMISYGKLLGEPQTDTKTSDLSTATAIFKTIESLIIDEALFKQQRLTISDVAHKSGLNIKDLSWAINMVAEKNFSEYINALRIKYMKNKLDSSKGRNHKLLDLAFESGFSSKSTFNNVFKRELGVTPTQYVKNQQIK